MGVVSFHIGTFLENKYVVNAPAAEAYLAGLTVLRGERKSKVWHSFVNVFRGGRRSFLTGANQSGRGLLLGGAV